MRRGLIIAALVAGLACSSCVSLLRESSLPANASLLQDDYDLILRQKFREEVQKAYRSLLPAIKKECDLYNVAYSVHHKCWEAQQSQLTFKKTYFFTQFDEYTFDPDTEGRVRITSPAGSSIASFFGLVLDLTFPFLTVNFLWYPIQGSTLFGTVRDVELPISGKMQAKAILHVIGLGPYHIKPMKVPTTERKSVQEIAGREYARLMVATFTLFTVDLDSVLDVKGEGTVRYARFQPARGPNDPVRFTAEKIMLALDADQFTSIMEKAGYEPEDLDLAPEEIAVLVSEGYLSPSGDYPEPDDATPVVKPADKDDGKKDAKGAKDVKPDAKKPKQK